MAEDKANKALRKVILNFTNQPFNAVASDDEIIKIDVSDKLPEDYYFSCITVDRGGNNNHTVSFMERDWLNSIAKDIDTILDATLVNSKQRESVGQLIRHAIFEERGRWSM